MYGGKEDYGGGLYTNDNKREQTQASRHRQEKVYPPLQLASNIGQVKRLLKTLKVFASGEVYGLRTYIVLMNYEESILF